MNYQETIDWLTHFPIFQPKNVINGKARMDLITIRALLSYLGNPQDACSFIHIAGTNGKGSTAAYLYSILTQTPMHIGFFTSPYLFDWQEQIQVDNQWIDDSSLAVLASLVRDTAQTYHLHPSIYEVTCAIAFLYFQQKKCNLVILEVGLGGDQDATNVVSHTICALITAIGLDHTELLGNTLSEIASHKSGIIKPDCDVIVYPQTKEVIDVIAAKCHQMQARMHIVPQIQADTQDLSGQTFKGYRTHLLGTYQVQNAMMAIQTCHLLQKKGYPLSQSNIHYGIEKTTWPCRFEIIQKDPIRIVDGSHNIQGVRTLKESLETYFKDQKIIFVMGVLQDKAYEEMIDILGPLSAGFFTITPPNPRALDAYELATRIQSKGYKAVSSSMAQVIDQTHSIDSIVCFFGSLYYVGQIRKKILDENKGSQ